MIQPTLGQVLREVRKMLTAAKFSMPELEARLLVEHASGKTREELARDLTLPADDEVLDRLRGYAGRRLDGEPVAYITGEWEFYSMPFYVTPDTLIPRADTEILAARAAELLRDIKSPRVLDLCAGTGCVGISIAANSKAAVTLADISERALEVCRKNISRHGLEARCGAVIANALAPAGESADKFDMIVCNPPYIPSGDIESLDRSVRGFEPLSALDGGVDGLDFYRAVTSLWKNALSENGYLLFECGIGQSGAVCAIMEREGYSDIRVTPDFSGIARVIEATK